ncbi:alpha-D-ribose 1-methylphosphonate 5-triphosphate diphosphatase [Halorubrum sp. JWXQ-INN 858]|uniref:alpha-D-ribose 1-methylphosphonate 5-triphosphate diphosphatase n=1 Tax=Halorubrum sp. JWXQ-INN 858 TaxID=2690782 RepID=UPI001358A559|nr:alpha-D-ribose 1-methylphosphonate 5-triphosphate diphosphatase [Halorubrum sp. JWXQ-INN 858]MWV65493.1 alpha-D-ribose 1-methylphosphonate 5-triphosphate diphosphatase [Halorubrum sp. JWXQ-INN 858]
MTGIVEIRNGRVVTPDGVIEDGRVVITGERIAEIGRTPDRTLSRSATVDADGRVVMPGLIDLHGDDIERHRYPRSGARVDADLAVTTADRVNAFNGVTTKFHAVAFEETPAENRTLSEAIELSRAIERAESTLIDNRLHARCELSPESVDAVEAIDAELSIDLLSMMHHQPGDGQFDDESFRDHYMGERDLSREDVDELANDRCDTAGETLDTTAERVARLVSASGIPLASHDDEDPRTVDRMAELGTTISEFPLSLAAAERATERGLTTVMGAPNLVRGGSLWDNLSAREAIDAEVVGVLSADYHPPSLLAAPFVNTGEPLADRVARVTANPAAAVNLPDRGRLERGARADVLVVDPDPVPTVDRVYVGGREVVRTDGGKSAVERPRRRTAA